MEPSTCELWYRVQHEPGEKNGSSWRLLLHTRQRITFSSLYSLPKLPRRVVRTLITESLPNASIHHGRTPLPVCPPPQPLPKRPN